MFTSNEDYGDEGSAPKEERAELERVRREGNAAGLSVGTVHGFVLGPDGRLRDTVHVALIRPDTLAALLEKHVRALETRPGSPVAPVRAFTPPPSAPPGSLRLHLVARYLEKRGENDYALVTNAGGNWSALPGEDWITLDPSEQAGLLAPKTAKISPGQTWDVDGNVAGRLFDHFYPPTENNDVSKNRRIEQRLRATLVGIANGRATVRLDGRLRMKHPFYHRADDNEVEADVAGYFTFDPARRQVRSLQLATERAVYGDAARKQPFGVAVRSVP